MIRFTEKRLSFACFAGVLAVPQTALAHAGDHSHIHTFGDAAAHVLGSPVHLVMIALAASCAVGLGWLVYRKRR